MSAASLYISVEECGTVFNVFKILLYGDGGFGIILPRLKEQQTGCLEKMYVDYPDYGTRVNMRSDEKEQYGVDDIVKFSYHPDGFVQFSSTTNNKIVSGRNQDGSPKGLGVMSWPLSNPIKSGESITSAFWGLQGFKTKHRADSTNNHIFKTEHATLHPDPKAQASKERGVAYSMGFFIGPTKEIANHVVEIGQNKYMYLALGKHLPDGSVSTRKHELMRVIDMPGRDYKLLINWFRIPTKPSKKSGYSFCGPSDGKRCLMATYPSSPVNGGAMLKSIGFGLPLAS